ncbi:tyrosine-protein phosphatase [Tenggerimyces flavus]|uniref:Tyrosine-protein phosphatase n=1 Tax=Tenggerimyces flavus TaxID=1708749 RepID=A0ABV7Y2N0_9ACTN|nr:tyrosine-protein phosphatase [Tenggerimyces flavus]MBM7790797.1 protein tyrosine/serine phosphatase [Tenggerimyces flavus]
MTGPRQLQWPNCLNVRDLGGLPTSNGRQIAAGALIRSDNLSRLTEAGVEAVRRASVSRIVDVRTPPECEGDPSPFANGPLYRNQPLYHVDDPYDPTQTIDQQYMAMLDRNPAMIAAAVGAIADAPSGGVVVHCHAGKDRSGNVIALALSLAGVPADAVVADYAVLDDRMRDHFAAQLALVDDPTERDQLAESFTARPATMFALLEHLEDRYGGAEPYLRQGGLGDDQVDALRARLVS